VTQSRPAGCSVCSMRALGQHTAVAHHYHALQLETLLQLVDLRRQCQRIGGIAFEHLDRDRAAVGRAHQADENLRPVTAVVAAVAILRQFAAASFEIGRGDIVEQQRTVLQVTAGQCGFDKRLLAAQPIERGINLLGGDSSLTQNVVKVRAKLAPCAGGEPAASVAPGQTVPSARARFPDQDSDGSRHRQRDHGESRLPDVFRFTAGPLS